MPESSLPPATPVPQVPRVLFVCQHGSAKSIVATMHFRRMAAARGLALQATSAGMEADVELPLGVQQGLLDDGLDTAGLQPLQLTPADLQDASAVASFGCDVLGLAPPALSIERWDDVPPISDGYATARDAIVARVEALVERYASRSGSPPTLASDPSGGTGLAPE